MTTTNLTTPVLPGFEPSDFQVFQLQGLEERMQGIDSLIRPKFRAIGERLIAELAPLAGKELHLHIAKHAPQSIVTVLPSDHFVLEEEELLSYLKFAHRLVEQNSSRIVLLGLEAPEAELERAFAVAAGHEAVKGFAVGRTLFNEAAEAWLAGKMDDKTAINDMAARFASLVKSWQRAQERRAA